MGDVEFKAKLGERIDEAARRMYLKYENSHDRVWMQINHTKITMEDIDFITTEKEG